MPKRGLWRSLPPCNGAIGGRYLSSTFSIPAVWRNGPVANVCTKAWSRWTRDPTSLTTKRHFNRAGMDQAADLQWLSGLVPNQRSTVSFLDGLCFLHLVDPVQRTIWTACLSHWNDVTGIAMALCRMHYASLRPPKYRSRLTQSVESAMLLKHQATWFSSYPFGIAHHSAESSRVLIPGCGFFIIRLMGALVRGISSLRHCFVAFAFSLRYRTPPIGLLCTKIWKVASWEFDWQYACLWPIIVFSGSSELTLRRFPHWGIWSEKWFRWCIFTKWKYDLSTRCCAFSDSICISSSTMRQHLTAAERFFQESSLSHSSCLSKVSCCFKAKKIFFVDWLAWDRLNTSFWLVNSSGQFSMYSNLASVWYRYYPISGRYTKFITLNTASVKGILWLTKGSKRVGTITGTITRPSAFILLPFHCVTWEYGMLNRSKPGYGGIITQSWLNLSILEWCLSKDVTQSIKCLSTLR